MSDPHRYPDNTGARPGGPDDGDTSPLPLRMSGSLADELLSPGPAMDAPPGPPPPPPPPGDGRSRALKALGLVLVAMIAGVIWWLIRDEETPQDVADEPGESATPQPGVPGFTPALDPVHDSDCAQHSYGDIRSFFVRTPCAQLSRGLYTAKADGKRVLVSVSVVRMNDTADARKLKRLTDTDGTGNVADLVREGRAPMPDPPKIAGGAYESRLSGREVTIVESNSFDERGGESVLSRVSTRALRLAEHVSGG